MISETINTNFYYDEKALNLQMASPYGDVLRHYYLGDDVCLL